MVTPQPTRVKPQNMLNRLLRSNGPSNNNDAAYKTVTLEPEAYIGFLQSNRISPLLVLLCICLKCLQP